RPASAGYSGGCSDQSLLAVTGGSLGGARRRWFDRTIAGLPAFDSAGYQVPCWRTGTKMSQLLRLLVLGAGGHGKAVAEAALLSGEWQQVVVLDDRWPELRVVCGVPVVGGLSHLAEHAGATDGAIAAVGNNGLRRAWQEKIAASGIALVSVVHPRACVSPSAS